ncbi:hypothetical protein EV2_038883 [Malus domestica]
MSSPRSHYALITLIVLFLSLLFTRGLKDGSTQPMFTFKEALDFLLQNRRKIFKSSLGAIFQRVFRPAEAEKEREKLFRKTFGEQLTLKDTMKSVGSLVRHVVLRALLVFAGRSGGGQLRF